MKNEMLLISVLTLAFAQTAGAERYLDRAAMNDAIADHQLRPGYAWTEES